jgi:hypothetical protein
MTCPSKLVACILTLAMIFSSIIMVESANAQTAALTTPEFSLKYYGNQTLLISIKNQAFTSYNDVNGNRDDFFFSVTLADESQFVKGYTFPQESSGDYTNVEISSWPSALRDGKLLR